MFTQIAVQFPWGWTLGALALSIVAAGLGLLILSVLLFVTLRRWLMGGVVEARLKGFFFKNTWAISILLAAPALSFFLDGDTTSGVLFLLAAAAFAAMQIPLVRDFTYDGAVVSRLAAHIWKHRYEVEKLQNMASSVSLAAPEDNQPGDEHFDATDRVTREEINRRFAMEQLLERKMYGSGSDVNELMEQAARQAGPGVTMYDGTPMPGSGPGMLAAMGEFVALYLVSLAGFYFWFGINSANESGVRWATPMLIGACVAAAVMVALPVIRTIRRRNWKYVCLVCGTATGRRVPMGQVYTHLCNETCEKELKRLYSLA